MFLLGHSYGGVCALELLASIESSIRQARALAAYRFDPKRMSTLKVPTLLLTGSETASPQLKQAISGMLDSLPNRSLFVFEGQQHNAMDTVPQQFAVAVGSFLLGTQNKTSREAGNWIKDPWLIMPPNKSMQPTALQAAADAGS